MEGYKESKIQREEKEAWEAWLSLEGGGVHLRTENTPCQERQDFAWLKIMAAQRFVRFLRSCGNKVGEWASGRAGGRPSSIIIIISCFSGAF